MDYKPSGVCSRLIHVELDGDKIANVEFVGGCAGNTAGISSLVKVAVDQRLRPVLAHARARGG